jgi:hypothetical protein
MDNDNNKNNSLGDDIRPPDEIIKECLFDYESDKEDDIDEELKLALSVSKRDYINNIQEETIFTNIVDKSTYQDLDYALEVSKVEYEEYIRASINKQSLLTEDILKFAFKFFDKDGSGSITADKNEVSLANLADGIYYITIMNNSQSRIFKVIKN